MEAKAARLGLGLAYVPEELITDDLAQGTLIRVLQRYSQRLEGSYLYYPHRNVSPALRAVIDTLRIARLPAGSRQPVAAGDWRCARHFHSFPTQATQARLMPLAEHKLLLCTVLQRPSRGPAVALSSGDCWGTDRDIYPAALPTASLA